MGNVASNMDQRVTFEKEVRVPDNAGGYGVEWRFHANVWARVEALEGRELVQAQQLDEKVTHRITIRNVRWLDSTGYRVTWRGQPMQITTAPDPGSRALRRQLLAATGMQT